MDTAGLLLDAYGRINEIVHRAVTNTDAEALAFRPEPGSNSIAWLVWHLTRVQDDHVSDVAGTEQIWIAGGFHGRFGVPFPPESTGFGHGPADVAAVPADGALLLEYFDATYGFSCSYISKLTDPDLDRIVDTHWDPPVSLGVRLVSVLSDNLQHAGQAAYLHGMNERLHGG